MHATLDKLDSALESLRSAPRSEGPIEALFIRPGVDLRLSLPQARLLAGQGLEGDDWCRRLRSNGDPPHPDRELTLLNSRVARLLAGSVDRWDLFGDQVYLDLDLSAQNLPVGVRLRLGQALITITDQPHLGCDKFARRFGTDALKFVNRKDLRALRLRGVYARVLESGEVKVGDRAVVLEGGQ